MSDSNFNTDTSTQYYGSTGSSIQTYDGAYGGSAGSVTGPQGNTAYYAQGPAGNTVVGTTNSTPYNGPGYNPPGYNPPGSVGPYNPPGYNPPGSGYYDTLPQGIPKVKYHLVKKIFIF